MKTGPHDEMNDDLRQEYDLTPLLHDGVRGKYAKRFRSLKRPVFRIHAPEATRSSDQRGTRRYAEQ